MKKFTADFETVTWLENETYVWAWAICDIDNTENFVYGTDISEFIEYCKSKKNCKVWFHNLKFDGEFIIYWLLKNGFKHAKNKDEIENNTFTTLISDMGQFYSITIYFKKSNKKVHKIEIYDSLKIIPFSVDETAKSFGLEISKLKIDYNEKREKGHILTDEEIKYIKNDVTIMAKALKIVFNENLTKMTRASNALSDFKEILTISKFNHYFPELEFEIDKDIRKAYKRWFYLFKSRI